MTLKWVLSLPLIWRNMILPDVIVEPREFPTGREDLITPLSRSGFTGYYASVDGMTMPRFTPPLARPIVLLTSLDSDESYSGAGDGRLRLHPQNRLLRPFCWRTSALTSAAKSEQTQQAKVFRESACAA